MGINFGKKFEQDFASEAKKAKEGKIFVHRLKDSDMSYSQRNTYYTPTNICDYFLFFEGRLYALELKTTTYKSISFDRNEKDKKMIRFHQIQDLTNLLQYDNVVPGFVFNFKDEEKNIEKVYFMYINDFNNFISNTDKSSINATDIVLNGGIPIEAVCKRKWFGYNIDKMIDDIDKYIISEEKEIGSDFYV